MLEFGLSYLMTEIFESEFHKKYVGGEGEVVEKPVKNEPKINVRGTTEEEVLIEYRRYIRDPLAELPEAIRSTLLSIQRTENGGYK